MPESETQTLPLLLLGCLLGQGMILSMKTIYAKLFLKKSVDAGWNAGLTYVNELNLGAVSCWFNAIMRGTGNMIGDMT